MTPEEQENANRELTRLLTSKDPKDWELAASCINGSFPVNGPAFGVTADLPDDEPPKFEYQTYEVSPPIVTEAFTFGSFPLPEDLRQYVVRIQSFVGKTDTMWLGPAYVIASSVADAVQKAADILGYDIVRDTYKYAVAWLNDFGYVELQFDEDTP